MGRGIDYGMGKTNYDRETGIRYGIISQHSLGYDALSNFEADYGDPSCPECGDELEEVGAVVRSSYLNTEKDKDYYCKDCKQCFWSDQCYRYEPLGWYYKDDEYELWQSDLGIWVFRSPYVTNASFCSPCAPGAVDLDSPCDDGAEGYCLGPEWFDDDRPSPYVARKREE